MNSGTVGSFRPQLNLHGLTGNSNLFSKNRYWELLLKPLWKYSWQTPRHPRFHHCPWYVGRPHFSASSDYTDLSALSERLPPCFWEMLASEKFLPASGLPQCNRLHKGPCSPLLPWRTAHPLVCMLGEEPVRLVCSLHSSPPLPLNANPTKAGVPPEFGKTKTILCWSSKDFELPEHSVVTSNVCGPCLSVLSLELQYHTVSLWIRVTETLQFSPYMICLHTQIHAHNSACKPHDIHR